MTALPLPERESALVERWLAGFHTPLRLQDGRSLRVIFPGIPGPGPGPDIRDALLDAGGDYLKGHVEMHLLASGWSAHGHGSDPAYRDVVLHAVARDDIGAPATIHGAARAIPVLVLPPTAPPSAPGAGFTPPCAFEAAQGQDASPVLRALSLRRLRMKAARLQPNVEAGGPAQALYAALLAALGGPANAAAFALLAGQLPLNPLLEAADARPPGAPRARAMTAALKGAAFDIPFRQSGIRPAASPGRRLESAGALFHLLWPGPGNLAWPPVLAPGAPLVSSLCVAGLGRALAIELAVNAILPAALASAAWPEPAVQDAWFGLPSPGTYGHLRNLESWLGAGQARPFRGAATLQAGLLLHADYCSRGQCGRCPLSVRA